VNTVAVVHIVATAGMFGLIWFVQVVHYPLFDGVEGDFSVYAERHGDRTSLVVGPLMVAEAVTAAVLLIDDPSALTIVGFVLVAVVWLSTAFIQVPCHRRLAAGFDPVAHRRLVTTNWLRTAAWSARLGIAIALVP
jgi:hypothetical protein